MNIKKNIKNNTINGSMIIMKNIKNKKPKLKTINIKMMKNLNNWKKNKVNNNI